MIFRIYEDGVVGTSGHARLATDANRFIKVDNAVSAFEHRGGGTRRHAGRVRALIAARYLMRAANSGKDTDVNVFHVRSRYPNRYDVFRFAGGGAGVTANAARVVDHLGPLDRLVEGFCLHRIFMKEASANYIMWSQNFAEDLRGQSGTRLEVVSL